jgi:pilus assembly protein CpaC
MSNGAQSTIKKLPGAGDLPIVGALFKSTSFRKGETELVIVVTPYLVQPVNANEIKLPTDGYQNPNMAQQILGNQESAGKSGASRPMPTAAPDQNGAPPPKIGELDVPGPLQNPRPGGSDKDAKKSKRRGKADSADTAPGFDL